MPDRYELEYSRDFCLPIVEIWCHGETDDPQPWSGEVQPTRPYYFFIREHGLIQCHCDLSYVEQHGGYWIHFLLDQKIKEDPEFVQRLADTFRAKIKAIEPLLESEPVMNLAELKIFTDQVRELWGWFAAV